MRNSQTSETILKVVNVAEGAQTAEIKLDGAAKVSGPAKAIVLTSENATDENTLTEPTKVVPVTKTVEMNGTTLRHSFPGNSVTILRAKAKQLVPSSAGPVHRVGFLGWLCGLKALSR